MRFICDIENIETRFIQEFILIESGREEDIWTKSSFSISCWIMRFIWNIENIEREIHFNRVWTSLKMFEQNVNLQFHHFQSCVLFVISKISKHVLFKNFNRVRISFHLQFHIELCVLFKTSKISNEKHVLTESGRVWRCLNKVFFFNFTLNRAFYLKHRKYRTRNILTVFILFNFIIFEKNSF